MEAIFTLVFLVMYGSKSVALMDIRNQYLLGMPRYIHYP